MKLHNAFKLQTNTHLSKHDDMDSYLEDKLGDILKQVERWHRENTKNKDSIKGLEKNVSALTID